jgi:hypothetical protein
MSNRSLLEFNHDYSHKIKDDPQGFLDALQNYLRAAYPEHAETLGRFGIHWHGVRHHSDDWEDHIDSEGAK